MSVAVAEEVPVTLARIDGKLDLIASGVETQARRSDVIELDVREHSDRLHALELVTLRLDLQATSSAATVITTAAAVKAADEARQDKNNNAWSPAIRLTALAASLATLLGVVLALTGVI